MPTATSRAQLPAHLRSCPACGFRGEGMAYFHRSGNLVLLGLATVFTYGVGGLAYWLLKRKDRVCPSCGLSWSRSRPMGPQAGSAASTRERESGTPTSTPEASSDPAGLPPEPRAGGLPLGGMARRVAGVLVALTGLAIVAMAVASEALPPAAFGGIMTLGGTLLYGWGWAARRHRQQAVLERTQRRVIHLAHARGGRLTATDVATSLDMGLPGAERVLLSLDDGFRVRSEVTKDGILVFDFPEVTHAARTRDAELVDWHRALEEGDAANRAGSPDAASREHRT